MRLHLFSPSHEIGILGAVVDFAVIGVPAALPGSLDMFGVFPCSPGMLSRDPPDPLGRDYG
jgi:hypothetical protein